MRTAPAPAPVTPSVSDSGCFGGAGPPLAPPSAGEPDPHDGGAADATLSALLVQIKDDLQRRFERGERPAAAEYLALYPELRDDNDRAISLIYEEFCLLEERGERPDTEAFCERYAPWRDSLESQLRYDRAFCRAVGPQFPEPGEYFEEFLIRAELGRGGAGRVYLARDKSLGGRPVALKVSPERGSEPSILGRLSHPNIVPVHSVVFQPETQLQGLCMPYRPGLPLDGLIRRVNPAGFDLRLVPALDDVGDIPTGGKNLIVVAAMGRMLHFRVFDGDGKAVVATDETKLTGRSRQIDDLRKQLGGVWPPRKLTGRLRRRLIATVLSAVDPDRPAFAPRTARALWEALARPPRAPDPVEQDAPRPGAEAEAVHPSAPPTWPPRGPGWAGFPTRGSYADAVAWVVATLARALHHAHGHEIQHRDVKPANVLLTYLDGPQLLDFNLAHDAERAPEHAAAALRGGTLPYMAPEQLRAFLDPARWNDVDPRADLYSLGLVLREMLTGQAPETPDPELDLPLAIQALLDRRPQVRPDLRRVNPRLPHALEAIVGRCLEADPARRYASAAALADDLDRFVARRPLRHAVNPSRGERAANWVRRYSAALLVTAAVVTVVALAGSVGAVSPPGPGSDPTFRRAVQALDAHRADAALGDLKQLSGRYADSPLFGFYLSAALDARAAAFDDRAAGAQARKEGAQVREEAESWLRRVWGRPGARGVLVAWGRSQPGLGIAGHAEVLGSDLLQRSPVRDAQSPRLDLAARTLELAQALKPESAKAAQGLAVVDERRGDLEAADARLSRAIEWAIAAGQAPGSAPGLWTLLTSRGRIAVRKAQALLEQPSLSAANVGHAEGFLRKALADLDRGRLQLTGRGSTANALFQLNYVLCEAKLALGLVLNRQDRRPEAERAFLDANELLAAIGPTALQDRQVKREKFLDLQRRVREHLDPFRGPAREGTTPARESRSGAACSGTGPR
jgi:hypothetical protein